MTITITAFDRSPDGGRGLVITGVGTSLLGLAAQHEQSGRRGVACRLYLRALVQSASNTADQR